MTERGSLGVLLSVHYNGSEVEIQCDEEGLGRLLERLDVLRQSGAPGHEHLIRNAWGGEGLTEEDLDDEKEWINHLKITLLATSK